MGVDLVSACIFCSGLLLGADIPPRLGLGGELGVSYATMARRHPVPDDGTDTADVTPKFVLMGIGDARAPADGLGAGTPAFEWMARGSFAPNHDEQFRGTYGSRVVVTGTGRYGSFALVGRIPVGDRDSAEAAFNRRAESATDNVDIGPDLRGFTETRSVSASRTDAALGWRHRWRGWEAEAALRWVWPSGSNATDRSSQQASGGMPGGEAEVRWRSGCWTLLLHAEGMSGSLDVVRSNAPSFTERSGNPPALLEAGRVGLGYVLGPADLFVTGTYERQKLPFVSIAVLGEETLAFDSGFDANSLNKEFYGDVDVRYRLSPWIAVRLSLVLAWGSETVTLADASGARPSRELDVMRRGVFGGGLSGFIGQPELALYIGADFALGSR